MGTETGTAPAIVTAPSKFGQDGVGIRTSSPDSRDDPDRDLGRMHAADRDVDPLGIDLGVRRAARDRPPIAARSSGMPRW